VSGGGDMEGAKVKKVHKLAAKLAKHSVKQMETTAIGGTAPHFPLLDPPLSETHDVRLLFTYRKADLTFLPTHPSLD